MKYEYLKGSGKDFEFCDDGALTKYRIIGHDVVTHSTHSSKKLKSCSLGHVVDVIAERRPITEPVWNGEGLPPVGVECEGLFPRHPGNLFEWQNCLVLYVFEHECAVKSKVTSTLHYCDHFRPIRSPEDLARDDTISNMISILNEGTSTQDDARDIYEAIAAGKIQGITKTPTVSELMRVTEKATREDCEEIVKLLSGK